MSYYNRNCDCCPGYAGQSGYGAINLRMPASASIGAKTGRSFEPQDSAVVVTDGEVQLFAQRPRSQLMTALSRLTMPRGAQEQKLVLVFSALQEVQGVQEGLGAKVTAVRARCYLYRRQGSRWHYGVGYQNRCPFSYERALHVDTTTPSYDPQLIFGRAMGAIGTGQSGSDPEIRKTFSCDAIWADAHKGASIGQIIAAAQLQECKMGAPPDATDAEAVAYCRANWQAQGAANVAGLRALDNIRRGLNELGYGPLPTGGAISAADREAWTRYTADKGVTSPFVSKPGICAIEQDLKGGVKGKTGSSFSTVGWMVALVAGGAATVAVLSGKKKAGVASAKAIVPVRG